MQMQIFFQWTKFALDLFSEADHKKFLISLSMILQLELGIGKTIETWIGMLAMTCLMAANEKSLAFQP